MSKFTFRILDRVHTFETSLTPDQLREIQARTERDLRDLCRRYSEADRMNILTFYIFELLEEIAALSAQISEQRQRMRMVKARIRRLSADLSARVSQLRAGQERQCPPGQQDTPSC